MTIRTKIAFVIAILCIPGYTSAGEDVKKIGADLSLGLGIERLAYEEDEPETGFTSDAAHYNLVARIEGRKQLESLFLSVRGTFPVSAGDDEERWNRSGALFQTNTLEFEWTRLDGCAGYALSKWIIPFGGFRYSHAEQKRRNFVILGIPAAGSAREKVISWSLFFGVMGRHPLDQKWMLNYRIAFFHPVDLEVTNNSLPGFRASEKDGYGLELEAGIYRTLSDTMGVKISAYGGRKHWEGSDFKAFPGGLAKWPENDTTYLGGAIHLCFAL